MTIDQQIAILQALKDGKKIEAQDNDHPNDGWRPWNDGLDFRNYNYRIVPEPRRFIIYKFNHAGLHIIPYGACVPEGAMIICTAIEEPRLESVNPTLDAFKQTFRSDEQVKADAFKKLGDLTTEILGIK